MYLSREIEMLQWAFRDELNFLRYFVICLFITLSREKNLYFIEGLVWRARMFWNGRRKRIPFKTDTFVFIRFQTEPIELQTSTDNVTFYSNVMMFV